MDGHTANRRQELTQLWLVHRHAPSEDDRLEQVLEAALPSAPPTAHDVDDGEPGFDAVAMVRHAQTARGEVNTWP